MSDQFTIETPEQLMELLQTAAAQQTPVYPVGGATSLDFGLPAKQPGWNVDLTGLNRVIDYPAADMTITVQAGMRIKDLQQTLAANQQQLPLDVPQADRATVGGVLATNFSGHRRFGYGTARDYVIGIRAIDGRGEAFAGGGRVVKNVAGYDFCKLLIGSLGTLGIITEVTFKLRPLPNHTEALIVAPQNLAQLDELLERLGQSVAQPIAVEWLVGPQWQSLAKQQGWPAGAINVGWLALLLEGLPAEVAWMHAQLQRDANEVVGAAWCTVTAADAIAKLQGELTEFPVAGTPPLAIKASVLPSRVTRFVQSVLEVDPQADVQAHAGNGIVRVKLSEYPAAGMGKTVSGRWQSEANRCGGNVIVLANRDNVETTARATWGVPSGPVAIMQQIKARFDPQQILNPGRFVYGNL